MITDGKKIKSTCKFFSPTIVLPPDEILLLLLLLIIITTTTIAAWEKLGRK
jgi:hypothetical protein